MPGAVVVVDDDEWVRRGRVHALEASGRFVTVVGISPAEALMWAEQWADVDVVIVDAHDASRSWDKFVGVSVVRAVRRFRSAEDTKVLMITGHAHNDLLRRRAADAGADWFFAHGDVRNAADLLTAITDPASVCLASAAAGGNGPGPAGGIDAVLDLVVADSAEALFEPGTVQKQVPVSRRRIITLRTRLSRALGLPPGAPLRSIVEVVNHARGAAPPPDGRHSHP